MVYVLFPDLLRVVLLLASMILAALSPHRLAMARPCWPRVLHGHAAGAGVGEGIPLSLSLNDMEQSSHQHPERQTSEDPRYQWEELRCVLAIVRHGDRTPKQKMKMRVTQVTIFFDVVIAHLCFTLHSRLQCLFVCLIL